MHKNDCLHCPGYLDLWMSNLLFGYQRYVSTKLDVSIRLSYFEKTDDTGRTDRRGATLNVAHYGRLRSLISGFVQPFGQD